jgi:DnaK suppressor protein
MGRILTGRINKPHQNRDHSHIRESLLARKEQLASRISELLGDVVVQREPDDEGAIAIENYTKDLTAAALARERRTLNEIEAALARLNAGDYGVCGACHMSIPKARLEALPWARLCVGCAERNAA